MCITSAPRHSSSTGGAVEAICQRDHLKSSCGGDRGLLTEGVSRVLLFCALTTLLLCPGKSSWLKNILSEAATAASSMCKTLVAGASAVSRTLYMLQLQAIGHFWKSSCVWDCVRPCRFSCSQSLADVVIGLFAPPLSGLSSVERR